MPQAAQQCGKADQAVDVEHDGRVDRVAHQRRRSVVRLHHDAEDDHLHQHCREREHHGAVGVFHLRGDDFRMVGHACRYHHDQNDDGGRQSKRQCLSTRQQRVLAIEKRNQAYQREPDPPFILEHAYHLIPHSSSTRPLDSTLPLWRQKSAGGRETFQRPKRLTVPDDNETASCYSFFRICR